MVRRIALACTVTLATAAQAAGQCPPLPDIAHCVATPHAWVYGRNAAQVQILAEDLTRNGEAFQRHFGRSAPRLAVLLDHADTPSDALQRPLRAQGAALVFDWPSAESFNATRMANADANDAGSRLLAAQPALAQTIWRSVSRHELGHLVFNLAYWPDYVRQPGHGHAGSPDWLNEMAAMLLEPDTLASHRRRQLQSYLADPANPLPELTQFLAMSNPSRPPAGQAAPKQKGVAVVMRTGDTSPDQAAGAQYYAQVQGWADFLAASSKNHRPGVFGSLAASIASGASFEQWLRAHGRDYGLPDTVQALDAAWQAWLDQQAPAA